MITTAAREVALRLGRLTFVPDGDDVVVGCVDSDAYAVLPPDGAALLERLTMATADEAARWYEDTYGDPVDMDDFLASMAELGFADTGSSAAEQPGRSDSERIAWQGLAQRLLSLPLAVGATALVVAALVAMVREPVLVPHTSHVFFSHYLLAIELTVAFGQIPLILVHEVCHVLAARRLGVAARIRISHRMYFVVFETVMDGIVLVPRARRCLPMLIGMMADVVLAAVLTLVAAMTVSDGHPSLVGGVCLALAFSTLVRFALEFLLFLRTDVYYLICTLTGAVDLHTMSSQRIANWFWRLARRPNRLYDKEKWHPRDVRAARWYTPLHVLGYGLAIALLGIVLLPITWRFVDTAAIRILHPDAASATFWDSLGLLVLNTAQPALAGLLWLRERARPHSHTSRKS